MEEFWIRLLAILTLLTQTSSAGDPTELIGAVGGAVTFRIPDTDTGRYGAFWNFGNRPIAMVAFGDPPLPLFSNDCKTRCAVSESGRALNISQLRMEDAGTYSVKIDKKKITTFTLQVYKELTEPTVTCKTQNCSGGICFFSLRCSVIGTGFGDVSYTWTGVAHPWELQSMEFLVKKSSLDEPEPLRCAARNAVSSRNVTVTIPGGLCSGAPSGSWVRIRLVAGVEITTLLSVFLIFFCKS